MDKGSENYMNEEQLLSEIKKLEGVYLQPQTFKQYKNYWLPEKIVKETLSTDEKHKTLVNGLVEEINLN